MYGQHTRLENEILNKILSYHFFVESYTFFCIFCQARPRVSGCVFHAIPTQRHATVTVGPGDEADTMPRPYSAHDLRWRMIYQRLFYRRKYKKIVSQLFVCPKTVYRTITFLNSGDVTPYRLGRSTGSASLLDREESVHNGLYSSNTSDTAT